MASTSPQELQYQQEHRYQDRATDIVTSTVILLAAAYVAVFLRFISRRLMRTSIGADDWIMVMGLVNSS